MQETQCGPKSASSAPTVALGALIALWAFAVAQPVYEVVAASPEFLAVRGLTLFQGIVFALVASLSVPLALFLLIVIARCLLPTKFAEIPFLLVAVPLVWLFSSYISRRLSLPTLANLLIGLILSTGFALFWLRSNSVRRYFRLLGLVALALPFVFLLRLPASIWSSEPVSLEASTTTPENPVPIVFLVFDELPVTSLLSNDMLIDQKSYPNFARLARTATWYRYAVSVSDFTTTSIPAMLSGHYPNNHYQPTSTDYPVNLFSILEPHYKLRVSESLTRLSPDTRRFGQTSGFLRESHLLLSDLALVALHTILPVSLTERLPVIDQTWGSFGLADTPMVSSGSNDKYWLRIFNEQANGNRAADFVSFLSDIDQSREPRLYFYASFLPHVPYVYQPSGRLYSFEGSRKGLRAGEEWGSQPWPILQSYQRHLLQVGFVDRQIGLLIDRLKEENIFESCLLIVTADHGVHFAPDENARKLEADNFADIVGVPLFVKFPNSENAGIDDGPRQTVDILPTILDVLDVDGDFDFSGTSLVRSEKVEREEYVVYSKYSEEPTNIDIEKFRLAVRSSVERKVGIFGSDGFGLRFFQLGRYGYLVGQGLQEVSAGYAPEIVSSVDLPVAENEYRPETGFVPAHITGRTGPIEGHRDVEIAVAVDGTVSSVTQPEAWSGESSSWAEWSTVVPEAAFRAGRNDIDVAVIRGSFQGPEVTVTRTTVPVAAAGLAPYGARRFFGVEEEGFYRDERFGDRDVRWTDGEAKIVIPVEGGGSFEGLRLELLWTGPGGCQFELVVDGVSLFRGPLGAGGFVETFALPEGCQDDGKVVVELRSSTFVPADTIEGSMDERELGVAVGGIWLLEDLPEELGDAR